MAVSPAVASFVAVNVMYPTYFSKKFNFLLFVFFILFMASMGGSSDVRKEECTS
jgi:hypothetical protein